MVESRERLDEHVASFVAELVAASREEEEGLVEREVKVPATNGDHEVSGESLDGEEWKGMEDGLTHRNGLARTRRSSLWLLRAGFETRAAQRTSAR